MNPIWRASCRWVPSIFAFLTSLGIAMAIAGPPSAAAASNGLSASNAIKSPPQPGAETRRLEKEFREGLGAYQANDYPRALKHWLPAAYGGNASARSSIAYLYLNGLGVRRSEYSAFVWYAMAAMQGEATAQFNVGTMFLRGRVVDHDPASAYMWCDLAMKAGYPGAHRCRESAARNLNEAEMNSAEHRGQKILSGNAM
ncbi:MAG: tetratricopeptide repeat protein [Beijerinckiaceae bacterium]